jgi:non-ribosomal peptide synthetase component F
MTLLAAYQVLLAHYSGQEDIVVAVPIANRKRQEIEPLIGIFINTLAMRADLSGNPSFVDLLAQVRQVAQEAYDHQDLPLEQLLKALPERNLTDKPLFNVGLAFHNFPQATIELPAWHINQLEIDVLNVHLDIQVHLQEVEGALDGRCTYKSDLFETSTIERMMAHFQSLLAGIVLNSRQLIADLPRP